MKIYNLFLFLFFATSLFAQQPKLIQPVGHKSGIDMADYSPDGKYIVTASRSEDDRIAKVWEVASGKLLFNLNRHEHEIKKVEYSKDGKYILTMTEIPYLWNAISGELIAIVDSFITSDAAFSPDGKYVVYTLQHKDSVLLWDISLKKITKKILDKRGYDNILFSPDGKKILTYSYFSPNSEDSSLTELWDFETGKKLLEINSATGTFHKAVFSHNNNFLAVSLTPDIFLYDLNKGRRIELSSGEIKETNNPLFSEDDSKFAFTQVNYVSIWDIPADSMKAEFEASEVYIIDMKLSPVEKDVICLDRDGRLLVFDINSGQKKKEVEAHPQSGYGLEVNPDKKSFASYSYDNTVKIWKTNDYSFVRSITGVSPGLSIVKFSPDSTKIFTVDNYNRIRITDVATGKLLNTLIGHTNEIADIEISADGKRIISNAYDSTLRVWDVDRGVEMYSLTSVNYMFYKIAINPSGKTFITWEALESKFTVWDIETGKQKATQKIVTKSSAGHFIRYANDGKSVLFNEGSNIAIRNAQTGALIKMLLTAAGSEMDAMDVSADNKYVALITDSILSVWDIAAAKKIIYQKGIRAAYYSEDNLAPAHHSVHFSPDGKNVVISSNDGTAKVFDVKTNKQVMMLDSMYYQGVADAFYTRDSKKIITIGKDRYMILWDAITGQPENGIGSYTEYVNSYDLSPGNKYLVTATGSNLNLYDAATGKLLYKTVFLNKNDWLVTDSSDRYDGTEDARKLLYFACGNEIIELDQLKDQLWLPNLAERITKQEVITSKTLKEIDICGLTPLIENRSGTADYHFIITPRRGGLGETALLINGIEIKRYSASQLIKNDNNYELKINKEDLKDFLTDGQENNVTVRSFTTGNTISSRGLIIKEDKTKEQAPPPNLYAVMVGVSDYKGDELDLKYAAKDATDLSAAVSNAAKKLLNTDSKEHVFMYNLTTAADHYGLPEKNSIKKILEEIGKKATANDILLIFFAGHGVMEGDKKQFYFLTADASKASATSAIADVGISTAELTEWMKPQIIKAQKRILIFDACNSGQAIKDFVKLGNGDQNYLAARNDDNAQQIKAIDKLNEKSGLFILSASASNQSAYEMGRYAQGLLTYSLLKAIKQQPDILEDGKFLNLSRWFSAAEKTVSEVSAESGARQEPQIVTNTNFNIGVIDADVMSKIILPQEKPMFAASNFQNSDEDADGDNLDISKLVNLQLSEIAARGADTKIVYVMATNSPDAYTLSGRYDVKGNEVTIRVSIKKNNETKYKFEQKGTKDKLKELASVVVATAADWTAKNK